MPAVGLVLSTIPPDDRRWSAELGLGSAPSLTELGPMPAQLGSISTSLGPLSANLGPMFAKLGPSLINLGPFSAEMEPTYSKLGPYSTKFGPSFVNVGRYRPKLDRYRPNLADLGLFGPIWPNLIGFGRISATLDRIRFDQHWPILATEFGLVRPISNHIGCIWSVLYQALSEGRIYTCR